MEKDSIKIIGELADGTGEDFETMANIVADGLAAFGMSSQEATNALAKEEKTVIGITITRRK